MVLAYWTLSCPNNSVIRGRCLSYVATTPLFAPSELCCSFSPWRQAAMVLGSTKIAYWRSPLPCLYPFGFNTNLIFGILPTRYTAHESLPLSSKRTLLRLQEACWPCMVSFDYTSPFVTSRPDFFTWHTPINVFKTPYHNSSVPSYLWDASLACRLSAVFWLALPIEFTLMCVSCHASRNVGPKGRWAQNGERERCTSKLAYGLWQARFSKYTPFVSHGPFSFLFFLPRSLVLDIPEFVECVRRLPMIILKGAIRYNGLLYCWWIHRIKLIHLAIVCLWVCTGGRLVPTDT